MPVPGAILDLFSRAIWLASQPAPGSATGQADLSESSYGSGEASGRSTGVGSADTQEISTMSIRRPLRAIPAGPECGRSSRSLLPDRAWRRARHSRHRARFSRARSQPRLTWRSFGALSIHPVVSLRLGGPAVSRPPKEPPDERNLVSLCVEPADAVTVRVAICPLPEWLPVDGCFGAGWCCAWPRSGRPARWTSPALADTGD